MLAPPTNKKSNSNKMSNLPAKKLPMLLFLQGPVQVLKPLQCRIPCPMHYIGSFFKGGFLFQCHALFFGHRSEGVLSNNF